jgi:carbon monoxide dehydrogenase subunit G
VRVELTIEIARPPDEVFDYLTDLDKLPEWQGSAIESQAGGPLREGSRIVERRSFLGRDAETELEVACHEAGRRLTLRTVRGPVRLTIDHRLEQNGAGTKLQITAEGRGSGVLRFAGPAVRARAHQELRRDFDRLKEILERCPQE